MTPPNFPKWQRAGAELQSRLYLDCFEDDPEINRLITELTEIWRLRAIQLQDRLQREFSLTLVGSKN